MSTTIEQQLAQRAQQKGIEYSLDRLQRVLDSLGNPERAIPTIVHVAGTNGKGSTIAFLSQIYRDLGYSVGQYHSPHLVSYNERFVLNGHPISDDDLERHYHNIAKHPLQDTLTEFELLTAMAFCYFAEKNPQILCLETGLGGRLDATNVVHPSLSILTRIDKDHDAILGDTLAQIATEKAGIIKPNTPVISPPQHPDVMAVIQQHADQHQASLTLVDPLETLPANAQLTGDYQRENMALAMAAANILLQPTTPHQNTLLKSCSDTTFRGRFSRYQLPQGDLIIDGAHNPLGARSLAQTLQHLYPNQPVTLLMGVLHRKPIQEMLKPLLPICHSLYYCPFQPGESYPFEDVQTLCDIPIHLFHLKDPLPLSPSRPLVITGSLYFIGALMGLPELTNMLQSS